MYFHHLIWEPSSEPKLFSNNLRVRIALFFLSCLCACISEFEPKAVSYSPKLTVDGLITNQPGPYKITLRYSTPYVNQELDFIQFEENAQIAIKDQNGNETQLTHHTAGEYLTDPSFVGKVGDSYVLTIKLPDGNTYHSLPEELKSVPPIDTIYTSYEEFTGNYLRGEFSVYMDFGDPASTVDYYQWSWIHYKFEPYCRLYQSEQYGIFVATKCCGNCWSIDECYSCINLLSDKFTNGSRQTGVPVLKIPYDSKEPYFVQVQLKSLTPSAYKFWQSVAEQVGNSGGIFDKPPITIQGNIFNIDNPEEQVLGYFGASAVFEKNVRISRDYISKIPFGIINPQYNELSGCIECEVGSFRTSQMPRGW